MQGLSREQNEAERSNVRERKKGERKVGHDASAFLTMCSLLCTLLYFSSYDKKSID